MPINPASQDAQFYEALRMGFRVDKAEGATVATGKTSLFTISEGRVLITQIVGEVTTVIETQATAVKLVYDPTAAGNDVDLCATLDLTADLAGELYSITGDFSDALISLRNAVEADAMMEKHGIILGPGAVHQNSGAASSGGIKWTLWYLPLDDGASVVAA